mmetsp:Transcript_8257/g.17949  ORF Transcript_8257/g.17949 Transcript_8257/m.17949 type:complete len:552 (-) Transcript_8257:79-1734(-)
MWLALFIGFFVYASIAEAAFNIFDDAKVRSRDVTPILGRGYSIASGQFQNTCLIVGGVTEPSSDYSFVYTEIESESEVLAAMAKEEIATTVSAGEVAKTITTNYAYGEAFNTQINIHHVIAIMKAEKYYTTIDESESELVGEMDKVLGLGKVVNFFQSCGPNFIRSIRKVTEVTSIFYYSSNQAQSDRELNGKILLTAKNSDSGKDMIVNPYEESLSIKTFAFGLGLHALGEADGALVATDAEGFEDIMDTAFVGMQDPFSGLVSSIELVPWISNAAFYDAIMLDGTMSRNTYSCITNSTGDTVDINGEAATCNATTCGYNADGSEIFDNTLCVVSGDEDTVVRDVRKFNMLANAEFLVRVDFIARRHVAEMELHMQCLGELLKLPRTEEYNDKLIFNRRLEIYADEDELPSIDVNTLRFRLMYGNTYTVAPLAQNILQVIGSSSDNLLFVRKGKIIRDYLQNFVNPCLNEFSEEHYGVNEAYMQLYHWSEITACNHFDCTLPNTQWLGANGTCVGYAGNQRDFVYLGYYLDEYCPPLVMDADPTKTSRIY